MIMGVKIEINALMGEKMWSTLIRISTRRMPSKIKGMMYLKSFFGFGDWLFSF